MAYVVVLHLAFDSSSMLHAIFQRCTQMPLLEVMDDLSTEPNHVYIVPPGYSLAMNDGHLRLDRLERTRRATLPSINFSAAWPRCTGSAPSQW
jgi:two-component system CheB/CheR fusion protein